MCGGLCGGFVFVCGEMFLRIVHVDRFGWGRKFLAHATLFLMVPKS